MRDRQGGINRMREALKRKAGSRVVSSKPIRSIKKNRKRSHNDVPGRHQWKVMKDE